MEENVADAKEKSHKIVKLAEAEAVGTNYKLCLWLGHSLVLRMNQGNGIFLD